MADTCAAGTARNWPSIPYLQPLPVASLGLLASVQFLPGSWGLQEMKVGGTGFSVSHWTTQKYRPLQI